MGEKYKAESYKYFDTYPFTRAQANRIHEILKGRFDAERIEKFVDEIRDCCEGAAALLNQKDGKTYINDRKSMLKILEKSEKLLDEIRKGRGITHIYNFAQLKDGKREGLEWECQELAVTTGNMLSMLIRKLKSVDTLIEEQRKKQGRPTADARGIIREVASIWEKCFDKKPTKYIGGPFSEVIQVVLKGLKVRFEYPEKKIRDALK